VQWTLTLHTERSQETGGQRQLSSRKVQGTATERSMCTPHTHWLVTVLQVMTRSHMAHSSQVGPRPTQQKARQTYIATSTAAAAVIPQKACSAGAPEQDSMPGQAERWGHAAHHTPTFTPLLAAGCLVPEVPTTAGPAARHSAKGELAFDQPH